MNRSTAVMNERIGAPISDTSIIKALEIAHKALMAISRCHIKSAVGYIRFVDNQAIDALQEIEELTGWDAHK